MLSQEFIFKITFPLLKGFLARPLTIVLNLKMQYTYILQQLLMIKSVLRIRSIFFRIRIRGSGFENTDPDPDPT